MMLALDLQHCDVRHDCLDCCMHVVNIVIHMKAAYVQCQQSIDIAATSCMLTKLCELCAGQHSTNAGPGSYTDLLMGPGVNSSAPD